MKKRTIIFVMILFLINIQNIFGVAKGKFINPITDICWSCFLPFTIGDVSFSNEEDGRINNAQSRDVPTNPRSFLCSCGIPKVLGVPIGFWEPIRLIDVTHESGCMVTLGGFKIGFGQRTGTLSSKNTGHNISYAHTHLLIFPLTYMLNLFTDTICANPKIDFGIAYVSELDPTYTDNLLPLFVFPETLLLSNAIATIACVADCIKATKSLPFNHLFWCSGCNGNVFPISGWMSSHYSNAQKISLHVHRVLYKMHRFALMRRTALDEQTSKIFIPDMCDPPIVLKVPKWQYKIQMTYPVVGSNYTGDGSNLNKCVPIGIMPQFFGRAADGFKDNGNFGVILWRKRNCCFL